MITMLIGVFSNRTAAEESLSEFEAEGFQPQDFSLILKNRADQAFKKTDDGQNILKGALSGILAGGLIGMVVGFLMGIGTIAIPGLTGSAIVVFGLAGAAATTLTGLVTGAILGALIGTLIGLAIPEKKVVEDVKESGIVLAVPVATEEEIKARSILNSNGADMIRVIRTSVPQPEPVREEPRVEEHRDYPPTFQTEEVITPHSARPTTREQSEPIYASDVRADFKDLDETELGETYTEPTVSQYPKETTAQQRDLTFKEKVKNLFK